VVLHGRPYKSKRLWLYCWGVVREFSLRVAGGLSVIVMHTRQFALVNIISMWHALVTEDDNALALVGKGIWTVCACLSRSHMPRSFVVQWQAWSLVTPS
jgi:hypothetical protein